jgi:hypothetical protein
MPDIITAAERRLIDSFPEERVQRIPRGATAFEAFYCQKTGYLRWKTDDRRPGATLRKMWRRGPLVAPEIKSRRERVRELHAKGLTVPDIASILDASEMAIRKDLQRLGLRVNRMPPSRHGWPIPEVQARRDRVAEMFHAGATDAHIAEVLGMTVDLVRNDRRQRGLLRRLPQ